MRRRALSAAALLTAVTALAQNLGYQPDPRWQAPAEAAARANPLAGRPELAAGGRKLFLRHCAQCHGESGEGGGRKNAADLQLPAVQGQSDGTLHWKITNGNPDRDMPSFARLPELQRWQLVLYLRQLAASRAAESQGAQAR